jgi:LDH2 family malate/lactate/ureidoglycolate dehydrogenase
MAGHKGYVISFMMDVLAGVLTGSSFGHDVAGPYEADRRSGCGHLLITIDVAALMPPTEFGARMEALIGQVKAVPPAAGVSEIFFPGELEARNTAQNSADGLAVADNTWSSLARLADETGVALPCTTHVTGEAT